MRMSHVTCMNELCHINIWVTSHVWTVMSHIWMRFLQVSLAGLFNATHCKGTATQRDTLQHIPDTDLIRTGTENINIYMQHTATHCNTLPRHCNTLQRTATHPMYWSHPDRNGEHHYLHATHRNTLNTGKTLQDAARHCKTLQDTATHCNTLPTLCNTSQQTTTHCNTLRHTSDTELITTGAGNMMIYMQQTATQCNTIQRSATHYMQHTAT